MFRNTNIFRRICFITDFAAAHIFAAADIFNDASIFMHLRFFTYKIKNICV